MSYFYRFVNKFSVTLPNLIINIVFLTFSLTFGYLKGGPIEKVSVPKDKEGNGRGFGFITYRHQSSVPYALKVFRGTRLFNRDLRLDNRNGSGNKNNGNNNQNQRNDYHAQLSNVPQNQFQMHNPAMQNMSSMSALTNPFSNAMNMNPFNNLMPMAKANNSNPLAQLNQPFDYQQLLASAQLFARANGIGSNDFGGNGSDEMHNNQSKMTRRQDNRPHNQNSQYSRNDRDRDRERDRNRNRRDRSRSRSPKGDWMRNNRDRNDRNSRNHDNNRRRNDNRR